MATRPPYSIADQLGRAGLAIENSLADAEIAGRVAAYGYSTEKLQEGRALWAAAQAAVEARAQATGAQLEATHQLALAAARARDAYQALSKVARAVCGRAALTSLGLDAGRMPRSTAGFVTACGTLFDNAANQPVLAEYGYDAARLAVERGSLIAFEETNRLQESAKGAAQQAARAQDAALAALNAWTARYIKIARVALRDDPQLLEKLGVRVRTTKTAAQRAARRR